MSTRVMTRFVGTLLVASLASRPAGAYIHFPPMTLAKMCQISHQIRVLKVAKYDKEKRVVLFEVSEALKKDQTSVTSFKFVLRAEAEGVKPVLDWLAEGKTAVCFSIETKPGFKPMGCAYIFIDGYCFSADYNAKDKYWLLIRGEPGLSACYHGPPERLRDLVKEVLAGKTVDVPTKAPAARVDDKKRRDQINEVLKKNR